MNEYWKYLPRFITTTGTSEEEIDILARCAYEFDKKWNFRHVEIDENDT